jgi:4-hydroxybenzoate polyprenyltransferase
MFENTIPSAKKVWNELKRFLYLTCIVLNLSYILTAIYALAVGRGFLPLNLIVLAFAIAYNVCYILNYGVKEKKKEVKKLKTIFKLVRLFANIVTFGIVVYSFSISSENVSLVSLLLAVISMISWLFGVLTFLFITYFEKRVALIICGFFTDVKGLVSVISFFKKPVGEKFKEMNSFSNETREEVQKIKDEYFVERQTEQEEAYK